MNNKIDTTQNRRQFISKIFPTYVLTCLGCPSLFANTQSKGIFKDSDTKDNFQKDFCRTYEKALQWRYNYYIELMEEFAKVIGRRKLIQLIKNGTDEINMRKAENDPNFKLSVFGNSFINNELYNNTLTFEIIDNTDELLEIKITKCLWAKTFRERKAEDIGYATLCHSDFSYARAVHPKVHLERTKTLMQGFDYCNFRYVFES